jgi:electron transfer flavoprotein alpha subunit
VAGIIVIAEALNGTLNEVSLELLSKGRELATELGQPLTAVLAGDGLDAVAPALQGADRVLLLENPALSHFTPDAHEQAIAAVIASMEPRLVMIGNTTAGMDLAAGLAARLHWPLAAYCTGLLMEGNDLIAVAQLYGGKLFAEVELGSRSVIVSVIPGSFPAVVPGGTGTVERVAVPAGKNRTRFEELIAPEAADVDIRKAPALVSVGRGIGGPENLDIVQELARAIGAEVAASRPVVDSGWLPKARQVGKSGLTVKPKLYFAVGISGAPEHLQGMKDAEFIVAVNTDASAPIFEVAHLGVVADALEFVPALTERVRAGA